MSAKMLFYTFITIILIHDCLNKHLDRLNKFSVIVNITYRENIEHILIKSNFSVLFEVAQDTIIIEYNGNGSGNRSLQEISNINQNQIISWETLRVYHNDLTPANIYETQSTESPANDSKINLVCQNYYGMGVENVWKLGITGRNVTVAITDVGINADLLDLRQNVDRSLSYNFVYTAQDTDVTPEMFPNMTSEVLERTDHGNRVASVVAAEKGNNICSAGISYDAKIAALKVFEVTYQSGQYSCQETDGQILAKAFLFKNNDIDIFVNAWTPKENFDPLDTATLGALKRGATEGRRELGMVYLVPSGKTGNALSNNIYTITVGSIGRFGTIPPAAVVDATVITSGLSEGNNINDSFAVTSSQNNKCITEFKGTSLATSQIAGIIALGLQVNPFLSRRDIQHLLVSASKHTGLLESKSFKRNGAGKYVHDYFGFGLLNASEFVQLASKNIFTPKLMTESLNLLVWERKRHVSDEVQEISFCYRCANDESCLTHIEYVEVSVKLETDTVQLQISVISPSNTLSVLMSENVHQKNKTKYKLDAKFVSTHFWDELPYGKWTIRIHQQMKTDNTEIHVTKIELHGTHSSESMLKKGIDVCAKTANVSEEQQPETKVNRPIVEHNYIIYSQYKGLSGTVVMIICYCILALVILIYCVCKCLKKRNDDEKMKRKRKGNWVCCFQ